MPKLVRISVLCLNAIKGRPGQVSQSSCRPTCAWTTDVLPPQISPHRFPLPSAWDKSISWRNYTQMPFLRKSWLIFECCYSLIFTSLKHWLMICIEKKSARLYRSGQFLRRKFLQQNISHSASCHFDRWFPEQHKWSVSAHYSVRTFPWLTLTLS